MPFAPVDDTQAQLFYEDSGEPALQDRPYTTLVAVHGLAWNSHIFKRLVPLAQASHIRLVLLNRRGYSVSTPYGEDELIEVDTSAASEHKETPALEHSAYMQRRGVEIARFLAWFCEKEQIPPRSDDQGGISGGISLLGWSLGNATTLSFLAYANTFDPALVSKLEPFLRKVVIYDPPLNALGYHILEEGYNPLSDAKLPVEERQSKFVTWVSSYFVHSPASLDLGSSLRNPIDGLEQHTPSPAKNSTMANMSSADMKASFDSSTAIDSDKFTLSPQALPVNREVRLRAIFGDLNETSIPTAFPKVDVSYVWCTQSVWPTVLAARLLKAEVASPPGYHYPVRRVRFFPLETNHFAHWDDPLKCLATFAAAIE